MAVLDDTESPRAFDAPLRELQWDVEQWLYREVEMLDERRYAEWLALMAEDVRYVVPLRLTRARKDLGSAPAVQSAMMEDDKAGLGVRVKRLLTGLAWSDDPPGMCRHLIANVRLARGARPDELLVRSNFLIYGSRLGTEEVLYAGERRDTLRHVDDPRGFVLRERSVTLDQSSLPSISFTIFF